jgi:hypothetical protein
MNVGFHERDAASLGVCARSKRRLSTFNHFFVLFESSVFDVCEVCSGGAREAKLDR